MNREELNRIILQGNPEDWDSLEEMLIFKGDLNLRIELADREYSDTGIRLRKTGQRRSQPCTPRLNKSSGSTTGAQRLWKSTQ